MMPIRNQNSSGFSLLELIVAIVLAGLSFAVLFSSMSTSLRNVRRLTTFEQHVEQAKSKLGELELISGLHPGDHGEGDFADGTRWRFEVFPYILPPVTLASALRERRTKCQAELGRVHSLAPRSRAAEGRSSFLCAVRRCVLS